MSAEPITHPSPTGRGRPILAVITNEITPYRVHYHHRIARELPELQLRTLLCRDSTWSAWKCDSPPEMGLEMLAEGELARSKGLWSRYHSHRRTAAAAIAWLSSHPVAAVIVSGYDGTVQRRIMSWCRRSGVPAIMHADSNDKGDTVRGWKRVLKHALLPRLLRRCSAVMCFGSAGRKYFRNYLFPDNGIFYSPLEPDYAQIENLDPAVVQRVSEQFGLDRSRFRFVVSSRLVPHKRVDVAIDAFLAIADEAPQWDLVVVGGGVLLESLKARVPQRLRSRVIVTGFVGDQLSVFALYKLGHVLVHPAAYEPWALVINEAAAADMAIISTDVVGAAFELVNDGVNGRLVPVGDVAAFSAAMRNATDTDRLATMRAASTRLLVDWRMSADPIAGLRAALAHCHILPLPIA